MKTLVYGLGESGLAAARALISRGEEVSVADDRDDERVRSLVKDLGVEGHLAAGPEILDGADRLVVSPGVRPSHPVLRAAERRGFPVVPEVGLGLELIGPDARVAAVTGTNGKTTVVDMLGRILEAAGVPHMTAGNSWRDLTGCAGEARSTGLLILEISSFQLHYLDEPAFEVAALLNARPDHMDWHATFEEYRRDKLRVFEGQGPENLAPVAADDPLGREAAPHLPGEGGVGGEAGPALVHDDDARQVAPTARVRRERGEHGTELPLSPESAEDRHQANRRSGRGVRRAPFQRVDGAAAVESSDLGEEAPAR